jgi:hypothetical protein
VSEANKRCFSSIAPIFIGMKRLVILLLFVSSFAKAQDLFHNTEIVARAHYGYIWAHRPKIEHIVTGHTSGFEISYQHQTDGSKWWQVVHGYPQWGFSLIHLNLANPELLGNADALVSYIKMPFVRTKKFQFALQVSCGLGYLSQRWQRTEDYKNLAISSHINAAIQFIAETRYRLSKKISANLNYGVTHFSNGAFHLPNLGINNISLNGGLTYHFSEPGKYLAPDLPEMDKHWQLDVIYGFGVKENLPPADVQFFAHSLSASFLKPFTYTSSVCIGPDFFYDLSLMRVIDDAASKSDLHKNVFRSGVHLGYELLVNKLTMLFHMGGYYYDKVKLDGSVYHRVGIKYAVTQQLFTNLTLKTHYFRADFVELGAGWKFKLRKAK